MRLPRFRAVRRHPSRHKRLSHREPLGPRSRRLVLEPLEDRRLLSLVFSPPAPLNTNAAYDSGKDMSVAIATDGDGNWVAVWSSDDDLGGSIEVDSDILFAHSTDNGRTWTSPTALNTNADTDSGDDGSPELATDGEGNWVAVWTSSDDLGGTVGTDHDILFARSMDDGYTWSAPVALSTDGGSGRFDYDPQVVIDDTGTWVVVWVSDEDPHSPCDSGVFLARSANFGLSWTQPVALNTGAGDCDDQSPYLTTDGSGNWVVVWCSAGDLGGTIGTDLDIFVSRSENRGVTWTDPVALNNDAHSDTYIDHLPCVATDRAGSWVSVWSRAIAGQGVAELLVARSDNNGRTWSDPSPFITYPGSDISNDNSPRMMSDGAGYWVAVWNSFDYGGMTGDHEALVSESHDNGYTWSDPLRLNSDSDSLRDTYPEVATDGAGNWVVVWNSIDDLGGTIGTTDPFEYDILVVTAARFDWGDAPIAFSSTVFPDGAHHVVAPSFCLGHRLDDETNAQQDVHATGDDLRGIDDEDGVVWDGPLVPGQMASVTVFVTDQDDRGGLLNAWIDFDKDHEWTDAEEHILSDAAVHAGPNQFPFLVPGGIPTGVTFARFRLSTQAGLGPGGIAPDGEVEDYEVHIVESGFGTIRGQAWDDLTNTGVRDPDDPGLDGVLVRLLDANTGGLLVETTTGSVDYDGTPGIDPFSERGLYEFVNVPVGRYEILVIDPDYRLRTYPPDGAKHVVTVWADSKVGYWPVEAPPSAGPSSNWVAGPWAGDEDEFFSVMDIEIDLPDSSGEFDGDPDDVIHLSGTTRVARGEPSGDPAEVDTEIVAMHLVGEGANLGRVTVFAGDGEANLSHDGDLYSPGIVIQSLDPESAGSDFGIRVRLEIPGQGLELLNDSDDPIHVSSSISQFPPYGEAHQWLGNTVSLFDPRHEERARILDLTYTPQVGLDFGSRRQTDWGDAPGDTYPTWAVGNGARHPILPGFFLGSDVDDEPDGQPNADATGDDVGERDDEDGVTFLTPLIPTQMASIEVAASADGYLDAWIDFGDDGRWYQPGDQIFASRPLVEGPNRLDFIVPAGALVTPKTFARFRFSSTGGLQYDGPAVDGEVEDYGVRIGVLGGEKWVQEPDLTVNGYSLDVSDIGGDTRTLADDFECTRAGRLTEVRFWGSWFADMKGELTNVHLGVYGDDPAGPGGSDPANTYAQPDGLLWEMDFGPGDYSEQLTAIVNPGGAEWGGYWWDPLYSMEPWAEGEQQVWEYRLQVPPAEAFLQTGTPASPIVYWLAVGVSTNSAPFGWRTRPSAEHFGSGTVHDTGGWDELYYPLTQDPIDMAFGMTYQADSMEIDWGDAPNPRPAALGEYPTLAGSNGAGHLVTPGFNLGASVDADTDGQQDPDALGDDDDGNDDEDGVDLGGPLAVGQATQITVTVTDTIGAGGFLNAWIDFDQNGAWTDPGEQVIVKQPVTDGTNTFDLTVPPAAARGGDVRPLPLEHIWRLAARRRRPRR